MRIREIVPLKGGRRLIRLESGIQFPLYTKEVLTYGLEENSELSDAMYAEIREEILVKRACKRLLYLLQKSDRTEWDLRRRLSADGYPEEVTERAVEYVRSYHYIDDLRYACTYIRLHQDKKSRRQLEYFLIQHGVDRAVMEQAFAEVYSGDEQTLIRQYVQKRRYDAATADEAEKRRMYQFLARKGFSPDEIRSVL